MPWSPRALPPDVEIAEGTVWRFPWLIAWEQETPVARVSHRLTYKATALTDVQATENIQMRFLSHVLVDILPDRAVPELLDAVANLYEYYLPVHVPRLLPEPSVKRTKVKFGRRYDRPTFPISEG